MKKNKDQACPLCRATSIGGQALIEGIMMRGPKQSAMAVRNTEGEIVLEKWDNKVSNRAKITKIPVVRGVFNFIDSMAQGYKCLMRSAEISGLEEIEAEIEREKEEKKLAKAAKKAAKKGILEESKEPAQEVEEADNVIETEEKKPENTEFVDGCDVQDKTKEKGSSSTMGVITAVAMVLGVALFVMLFIYLPNWVSTLVLGKNAAVEHPILLSVFSGLIKICILIGYMAAVSLMKDIRRTFMYHGAEHKTIFCYEQGLELTIENIRKQSRFHPRCGTSFLFLMLFVGILIMIPISFLLKNVLPASIIGNRMLYILIRTGITIVLMPLMMGIGYELIKLAGRKNNVITKIISAPGLWMQRITTKEPDDSMIECAIVSMKEVIPDDNSDSW